MLRIIVLLATASALLGAARELQAQRAAVELRALGAASTQKLAGTDLSLGGGLGATFSYRVQPHLAAYVGWDWIRFQADESFAGADVDFEETGYGAGLRFEHPIGNRERPLFRVEAGGTYRHIEIENAAGDVVADSGHDFGFEASGGVVLPLGRSWRVTPTMRFRSLSAGFEITGVATKSDLRYVGIELGVSRRF